jgi:hypothetical protein
MATILYKWMAFFLPVFWGSLASDGQKELFHPVYVSVTSIEHNAKEQALEISCKIYTDDFEKTLRKHYNGKIDLLDEKLKESMGTVVNDYIQKHLSLNTGGKKITLRFIGFEQQEEGIASYFQASNIAAVKNINVFNDLLYDYHKQQMGIVHVTVNGNRKSTRLDNPDANANFVF